MWKIHESVRKVNIQSFVMFIQISEKEFSFAFNIYGIIIVLSSKNFLRKPPYLNMFWRSAE